jgi:hypothetical protein
VVTFSNPPYVGISSTQVSSDLFDSDQENTSETHSSRLSKEGWLEAKRIIQKSGNLPVSNEAWFEAKRVVTGIKAHSHAWGKLCEELRTEMPQIPPDDMGFGESNANDLDGSESHYLNQLSDAESSSTDDSKFKDMSDETIVARYRWKRYSNELWTPAQPRPITRRKPESVEGWDGRTLEKIACNRRTLEGTRAIHCLNQLPETVSESTVNEETPTVIVEVGTTPENSEEEDSDAVLAA